MRFKYILTAIGLVSIVILVSLTPHKIIGQEQDLPTSINATTLTYSNPTFKIRMQYPSDWNRLDLSGNGSSPLLVTFGSPIGGPVGSLNLISDKTGSNLTYSAFVAENLKNLKQSGIIQDLNSSSPSSLAGHPAYKVIYTTISSKGIPFKTMQIMSLINKITYLITYATPSEFYPYHLPAIQKMINSIAITD
jgi:hypothetical protein